MGTEVEVKEVKKKKKRKLGEEKQQPLEGEEELGRGKREGKGEVKFGNWEMRKARRWQSTNQVKHTQGKENSVLSLLSE